jgi:BirA family transcriptional regulator, biotin operon repressor / biotin---[acetyl-CoA-carboxylase] ligase
LSSNPSDLPPLAGVLPGDIASALGAAAGRLGIFREQVLWYPEVPSTNDIAQRYAEHGAPEGRTVIADHQTAGRGRLGRTWASPSGAGLYVSVVLRPGRDVVTLLTLAAGVALADAIERSTGLRPMLKWPNDVWLDGRKLGGILTEAGSRGNSVEHAVVGFGLNISRAAYPPDVSSRAISLEEELGRPVDRGLVLAECLAALSARYEQLRQGRRAELLDAWRTAAHPMLKRHVEWEQSGRTCHGVAVDVDDAGALIVETPAGRDRIISGEVRWI